MQLHSIATEFGAALLVNLDHAPIHSVQAPDGFGLIFWGRCDRATFAQIVLGSSAEWMADYLINKKCAIVVFSKIDRVPVGAKFAIDTTAIEATCPSCGGTNYVANGPNWLCRDCNRQWRKHRKRQEGENR